jgi:hypothetical protein
MITIKCTCGSWNLSLSHGIVHYWVCLDCGNFFNEHTMRPITPEELEKKYQKETGDKSKKLNEFRQ